MPALEVEINLRNKNQMTLPEAIAERLGVGPGDKLILSVEDEDPHSVHLRPLLKSYAGILEGVYGKTEEEVAAYIAEERASWGE